jgi:hypothetical protein
MSKNSKILAVLCGSVSALALTASPGRADAPLPHPLQPITQSCLNKTVAAATLTPPQGQPASTQFDGLTQANVFCLSVIQVPGNRLTSFDISWADPVKALYFLGDRSNKGIDVINTATNNFKARLTGFVGISLLNPTSINNNTSGPNGVTSHGNWVYGGDGNSTLKVFDLKTMKNWPAANPPIQTIFTGGSTRVDEMDTTGDGCFLLAANNIEDPAYATLFQANCDNLVSDVVPLVQIYADKTIMPAGVGLSFEQPRWDPSTGRFVGGVPIINDPQNPGCNYGQNAGVIAPANGPTQVIGAAAKTQNITCDGAVVLIPGSLAGVLATATGVVGPNTNGIGVPQVAYGIYNPVNKTGIIPLTNYALTANASVNVGSAINVAPNVPTINVFSTSALTPETLSPYANPGLYWVKQSTTAGPSGLGGTGSEAVTYTGCNPNGVARNPLTNELLVACNQGNQPWNVATQVIAAGLGFANVPGLPLVPIAKSGLSVAATNTFTVPGVVGGDEAWFNGVIIGPTAFGDGNYYIAASKGGSFRSDANFSGTVPAGTLNLTQPPLNFTGTCATTCGPVLAVVAGFQFFDPIYNFVTYPLIGTIGESNGSHSVAADAIRDYIYVPQTAPMLLRSGGNPNLPIDLNAVGGDTTGNRQNSSNSFLNCQSVVTANVHGVPINSGNGCIVVYHSLPGTQGSPTSPTGN